MKKEYAPERNKILEFQRDYEARERQLIDAVKRFLAKHLKSVEEDTVLLGEISIEELASILSQSPILLKALAALCNIAQRDLRLATGKDIDTYSEKLDSGTALLIAQVLKPVLPSRVALSTLIQTDRWWWIDKERRKYKGTTWEKRVLSALNEVSDIVFAKRKFRVGESEYEIDACHPASGNIQIGVDIKRIQSPRDIHKRSDEIVNKAAVLKSLFPQSSFFAVIYYPFGDRKPLEDRFNESKVDHIVYADATEESIYEACDTLLNIVGKTRRYADGSLKDYS